MPTSASPQISRAPIQFNLTAAGWAVIVMIVAAVFMSSSSRLAVGFLIPLAAALPIDMFLSWHVLSRRSITVVPSRTVALKPDGIVLSPGPCTPNEAGISMAVIERFAGRVPLLGICLGHQSIGQVFGGEVVRARKVMHGKTSPIHHRGEGVFRGLSEPFEATRYHSLVVKPETLPDCLSVTARSQSGVIMGLRHRTRPIFGVQFHPESIRTEHGHAMLRNFLSHTRLPEAA